MATISGSNWGAPQNGTPAGTVKSTSANFPKFLLHMCVIKRGTTKTCGHWGCTSLSSHKSSIATSMAAGGNIHSLAAFMSFSSNMLCGVTSSRGSPPQFLSCPGPGAWSLVLHQLRTHFPTRPCDCVSDPRCNGRKDIGSSSAIIPLVWSPLERPSTPVALMLLPEICRRCRMKPPSLCALYKRNAMSLSSLLVECPLVVGPLEG